MRKSGLAQRYAQALFAAARAGGVEDGVGSDLEVLTDVREGMPSIGAFLSAPHIRDDVKHRVFDEALQGKVNPLTLRFVHLLLNKRRAILPETGERYFELLREHRGEVKARVTTAEPLAETQLRELKEALETTTGKTIELEPHIDQAVLGGIRVQWRDQIIDDTVRSRLDGIRDHLLEAEVL